MRTAKTVGRYFLRVLFSAPFIGAGILDALLLVLFALGININLPAWAYATFLGLGFLVENIRIFIELQNSQVEGDIVLGVYHQNHTEWGDAIAINQLPSNPDFQPSFGLVLSAAKPGILVKGVFVRMSFFWRGDVPAKVITIIPPTNDGRWKVVNNHITNQKPATFSFNGNQEVVTYAKPLVVPNLAFHVLEHLKGYILIEYEVTSLEPPKSKTGEVVINLSLN